MHANFGSSLLYSLKGRSPRWRNLAPLQSPHRSLRTCWIVRMGGKSGGGKERGQGEMVIHSTHDCLCAFQSTGKEWQPTTALLPAEPHAQRSLAGYSPRGRKEPDTLSQHAASSRMRRSLTEKASQQRKWAKAASFSIWRSHGLSHVTSFQTDPWVMARPSVLIMLPSSF